MLLSLIRAVLVEITFVPHKVFTADLGSYLREEVEEM